MNQAVEDAETSLNVVVAVDSSGAIVGLYPAHVVVLPHLLLKVLIVTILSSTAFF